SLPKDQRPTVGFCGATAPSGIHGARFRHLRRRIKSFAHSLSLARIPDLTPMMLRRTALDVFAADHRLKTIFVERSHFFGGAALPDGTYDQTKRQQVWAEYVENILSSNYTLCVRGAGNFSHRYFDTLAAGRIPVLVDTAGGIPFDFA